MNLLELRKTQEALKEHFEPIEFGGFETPLTRRLEKLHVHTGMMAYWRDEHGDEILYVYHPTMGTLMFGVVSHIDGGKVYAFDVESMDVSLIETPLKDPKGHLENLAANFIEKAFVAQRP